MTCGQDRSIRLWNPHKSDVVKDDCLLIKTYTGVHGYDIQDIAISKDNEKFSSCGRDKLVFVWDVASGRVIRRLQGHEQRVNAVEYNEDASVLLSGSYDSTVRIWDMRARHARQPIQILDHFKDSVTSIAVSSHEILCSSVDGCLRIYDLRVGNCIADEVHGTLLECKMTYRSREISPYRTYFIVTG